MESEENKEGKLKSYLAPLLNKNKKNKSPILVSACDNRISRNFISYLKNKKIKILNLDNEIFKKASKMLGNNGYLIVLDNKNIGSREMVNSALKYSLKVIKRENLGSFSLLIFKKLKMMYQPESLEGEINAYESKNPLIRFIIRNYCNLVNNFIKPLKIKNVLDVGCGEGYTIYYIRKKRPKLKFEGIDIMDSSLEKARELNPKITFKNLDFFKCNFKQKKFDLVLCMEVLEHLENPGKAVMKMKEASKKYCMFSVPNEPWWRIANLLRLAHIKTLGNTPHHLQNWTKSQFKRFLQKYFLEVDVKTSSVWSVALCKK